MFLTKKWADFIIHLSGVLIIIPLAPFICRFIPPLMAGEFNMDLIVALLIALVLVRLLIWLAKPLVLPALGLMVVLFAILQFTGKYTFLNLIYDYKSQVRQNWIVKEEKESDILNLNPRLFEDIQSRTARLVKLKIDPKDSIVRDFALQHSLDYFSDYKPKYGALVRYLSLFKYINHNFKYVPDPLKDEYYASARETIQHGLGGDCDDHSILMASCMMSIGARCRLVVIENHMYPELYIGNKARFDIMQQAIVQLFAEKKIERIFYHENNGEYWINLDYTANYPGGPYLNDKVKLVIEP